MHGVRSHGELPLCRLRREMDVVVLARVLIQVGNPALGERRR